MRNNNSIPVEEFSDIALAVSIYNLEVEYARRRTEKYNLTETEELDDRVMDALLRMNLEIDKE